MVFSYWAMFLKCCKMDFDQNWAHANLKTNLKVLKCLGEINSWGGGPFANSFNTVSTWQTTANRCILAFYAK